jgi:pyrrolidone-carboxylate peptidase
MKVILTGFGPFGLVTENPSDVVARQATEILVSKGVNCEVKPLEVSVGCVLEFYSSIPADLNVFVLHLGLDATDSVMKVEKIGRNFVNFVRPDIRGVHLSSQKVSEAFDLNYRFENPLDFDHLIAQLGDKFNISTDAGEYICNYIYFIGLTHVGTKIGGCLFAHVPAFKIIACEEQVARVVTLVEAILGLPQFQAAA